jgi:hypothetical protein
MTRRVFSVVCVVLFLAVAAARPAPAPDPDREVKAVIARAIEARGGAANLDKYEATTTKFAATFYENGMEIRGNVVSRELGTRKYRYELSMKVGGDDFSVTRVLDGDKGWTSTNGTVVDMTKEEVAEACEDQFAGAVSDLRGLTAPGVKLTLLGESKVGDKRAVGVLVAAKGHRDVRLYFDKDSGLLLKCEVRHKDPADGKEYAETLLCSNYKNVSGLMFAFHVEYVRDGKTTAVAECTEITVAERFPDGTFAKP